MKVFRSLDEFERGQHAVATIGTFDGLHHGHKIILQRVIEAAKERNGEAVLISFHPHPRLVLFPENNPLRLLQSLEEKIKMLEEIGIDKLMLIPFTKEFSRVSSKSFILDILVEKIGIEHIIIGYDHHFGKNRTGGIEELALYGPAYGYSVEEIPAQRIDDANVSSTKIRRALEDGDVKTANAYLGYRYAFQGTVIHGEKLGRTLGFPTANLEIDDPIKLLPGDGIYLVKVNVGKFDAEEFKGFGLLNIGKKPTVGEFERCYEVYIYDFDRDIYGKTIRLEMIDYLRGEKKFDSLQLLVEAMKSDKQKGLDLLKIDGLIT